MIDDPTDVKPDGYDDIEATVVDADATKPDDWDDEEDGEWEAPMVDNPEYMGEWRAKRIENPEYEGPWVHPEIDNPDYVEHGDVYKRGEIGMVGVEVWQVKSGTVFSDFIVADNLDEVNLFFEGKVVDLESEKSAKSAYEDEMKGEEEEPELMDEEDEDEVDVEELKPDL